MFGFKTKLVAGVAIAAVFFLGATPASASTTSETPEVASARAFFSEYRVAPQTQDALIEAYLAGEEWDSFSSSNPTVDVVEETRADGEYTISTYEDGSISVVRIGADAVSAEARGITQCSVRGPERNGCKIDTWVGVVQMSFYTSFNLSSNTVTADPWGPAWTIGGACSSTMTYLGRPLANRAQMNINAQMCIIGYTTTFELRLTVSGGVATVSWN
ncbi:hypothetical protein EDF35_2233 [Rathayibacter sp. PhB151]|uniref:hypothetical protein n=1 Tax=Rathayibacter sp. PhB151 TaxID=2485189 RepID=UPI001062BF60|nr:hypothetical protein [Rathayibacter sp. PhB151]TDX79008.1 hypothetical protein EDF35_2233 [Rathayibacter sp. PhB151]